MPDAATPPAAVTADDVRNIFKEQLGEALKGGFGELLKPITDKIGKIETRLDEERPTAITDAERRRAEAGKPLTADDIKNLVNTSLTEGLKQHSQQLKTSADREAFISTHLGKLPAAYKQQLGTDPAKWETESKQIQSSFEADFKGAGGKLENLGNPTSDGGQPPAKQKVDTSKMPAFERINLGLKDLPMPTSPIGDGDKK